MRKLLIMASLFYPQKNGGGPPVSIMNIVQAIKDKFEIFIISKNHEVGESKPLEGITDGWNSFAFGKVYYFPYGQHTVNNVYKVIKEIKPDVIYQNSFFSYDDVFPTLIYKKHHPEVGILVAPRGEICENRFSDGRLKKTVYIFTLKVLGLLKNVKFQATGADEEKDMLRYLGIRKEAVYNINNFSYANPLYISDIKKNPGELRLCFIARIQDTKNLLYAMRRLSNIHNGNVIYDVYGPIENKEYFDKCFSISQPENVKVNYCGTVEHDEVGKTIAQYHAYFLPTIGENYGHSIVEGMLYRRPVIISNKTPWNEINDAGGGFAIPLDKPEIYEETLLRMIEMQDKEFQGMCKAAEDYIVRQLNVEETINQYIKCFNEV